MLSAIAPFQSCGSGGRDPGMERGDSRQNGNIGKMRELCIQKALHKHTTFLRLSAPSPLVKIICISLTLSLSLKFKMVSPADLFLHFL